ncbi:NAD-binding protein [Halococcoides cellulosivorans]|uniref:Potassium transporter n=1 Tax=Halococcoides cellulosivorans TaxID=1679096 RepID=A0A2R4X4B4_9EURY|nr:NAD-binding protein [Halococcoides cellulosivorans]AWB28644.1 potassium transporter [Halococcoides cellulosivorans]
MAVSAGVDVVVLMVAAIFALGVSAQLLAARLRVPSIIFYILAGLIIGPVSGVVLPMLGSALGMDLPARLFSLETFGPNAMETIVELAVAIIVFEGAFHLKIQRLREAPRATLRLITLGAAIALIGTAIATKLAFPISWGLAFTIGALLVATGPTVIAPILAVVPVRDRVAAVLETEGIVNDVTAAITAVVVFDVVVIEGAAAFGIVNEFATRLGEGVLIGALVAAALFYLLRYVDLSAGDAPRNARLLVLAGAIGSFAVANFLESEAGVAAAATAGILLGNMEVPYKDEIATFKGDVTLLVLSFVFITLAGILEVGALTAVGIPGLAVVIAVALFIRPLLVFVSTIGDRFTLPERAFMSFVGPRGIIPASVATLFAIRLQAEGMGTEADILIGTVFLVILATAAVEGGLARHVAKFLDVIPMRVIIVGGGRVGRALAERLEDRGENVVIVDEDESQIEIVRNSGYTGIMGDGTDMDVLRDAGAENAKTIVAATSDDDVNLLVSQLADAEFDVENIIARVNRPENVEPFEDLGVRTISASMATAWAIDNQIERPAIAHWMTDVSRIGDVQEVELTNDSLVGQSIQEIGPQLPDACLIALVSRDGETIVPNADYTFERGDKVTLLGERDSVRDGMDFCQG